MESVLLDLAALVADRAATGPGPSSFLFVPTAPFFGADSKKV